MATPPDATRTLIIGAGLAGLSCALHLDESAGDALIVEKTDIVGGKARTEYIDGFIFDVTGHWLHLRDDKIRALIFELLGEDHFEQIDRISRIWSHGVYTLYPYQANVYGLPPQVIKECVMGAIEADRRKPAEIKLEDEPENFADWIRFYFGDGIAEHFMVPYNQKLWGVPAESITSRWCQRFVPRPDLEDIVAGAVGCNAEKMGYNAWFLYPQKGGIQSVPEAMADAVGRERIYLERAFEAVDLDAKTAVVDGQTIAFEHLVNTMALPDFLDRVTSPIPDAVRAARSTLKATETHYFNVGVKGPIKQPDHWIYVPELDQPMYRVGVFSNALPAMAPEGHASLYVELSDRETPPAELEAKVAEGLVAMDLIDSVDQVLFMAHRVIPHAYVVYDFNYHDSVAVIHDWLNHVGVQSIGRYGQWKYSSMEDAMIDGRNAANKLAAKQLSEDA